MAASAPNRCRLLRLEMEVVAAEVHRDVMASCSYVLVAICRGLNGLDMLLVVLGVVGAIGAGMLITAAAMHDSSCGRCGCKHDTHAPWQCPVPQEVFSTILACCRRDNAWLYSALW